MSWPTVEVVLALGASMGPREATLRMAVAMLDATEGLEVRRAGRILETAPMGGVARQPFLNAGVLLDCSLPPLALLARTQAIERALGRRPAPSWADRCVDIDVLLYGRSVLRLPDPRLPDPRLPDPRLPAPSALALVVPHPQLDTRPYARWLLHDVAPHALDPWTGRPWPRPLGFLPRGVLAATTRGAHAG